jgi:hypothetical protein
MIGSSILGTIAADDTYYRQKRVAAPGEMYNADGSHKEFNVEGGTPMVFSACYFDAWWPQTGLADRVNYIVPMTGLYQIQFHVRFPDVGVEGVGWFHGWSGDGGGDVWLEWWRGGSLIEGNIARQGQSWPGGSNPTYDLGPVFRNMNAGDVIRAMAQCGATGLGPVAWDADLRMYWHVGGGGPLGVT